MIQKYTIWKIARILFRSEATVKRYEARGLIPMSRRDPISNYRYWTEAQKEDIERFSKKINVLD